MRRWLFISVICSVISYQTLLKYWTYLGDWPLPAPTSAPNYLSEILRVVSPPSPSWIWVRTKLGPGGSSQVTFSVLVYKKGTTISTHCNFCLLLAHFESWFATVQGQNKCERTKMACVGKAQLWVTTESPWERAQNLGFPYLQNGGYRLSSAEKVLSRTCTGHACNCPEARLPGGSYLPDRSGIKYNGLIIVTIRIIWW